MFLAVDIGNTQTTLGLFEKDALVARWRIATVASATADELAIRLKSLFELTAFAGAEKRVGAGERAEFGEHASAGECAGAAVWGSWGGDDKHSEGDAKSSPGVRVLSLREVSDAGIASVVPPLTEQWRLAAGRLIRGEVLVLDSSIDTGLTITYKNPSEIGADRIADAVGALTRYGAPVIVVDFGTATNIEVVDKDGAFIGGVIAPGLATSAEALFQAAARLAKIDIEVPPQVIGTTTREAVQSGLTYGEIDRIDGLVRRIQAELGYDAFVVATGGLSSRVVNLSSTIQAVDDDLTLEGLRLVYERLHERPRKRPRKRPQAR